MTPQEIAKLESLAGLHLDGEERAVLAERLERLLEYVRQIESIDSSGVEPLANTLEDVPPLRADIAEESYTTQRALANAPEVQDSHFKIPSVMPKQDGDSE